MYGGINTEKKVINMVIKVLNIQIKSELKHVLPILWGSLKDYYCMQTIATLLQQRWLSLWSIFPLLYLMKTLVGAYKINIQDQASENIFRGPEGKHIKFYDPRNKMEVVV